MAQEVGRVSFLPAIKCSNCGREVDLVAMADHICVPDESYNTTMLEEDLLPQKPQKQNQLNIPLVSKVPNPFTRSAGQKKLSLDTSKSRPPAIDPGAANRPFFVEETPATGSSNASSYRSDSSSDTNNYLAVSNLQSDAIADGGNSNDASAQPRSPLRFFMPLMSPKHGSPTGDQNLSPLSPSVDNSNVLRRMDNITPGPFSKSNFKKPLPKPPSQPGFPLEPAGNIRGGSLSKKLPRIPPDNTNPSSNLEKKGGSGRANVRFADGPTVLSEGSRRKLKGSKGSRDLSETTAEVLDYPKPLRADQRSNTFPENSSRRNRNQSRDIVGDVPLGLPRRPSEPSPALRSIPSSKLPWTNTTSNQSKRAAPLVNSVKNTPGPRQPFAQSLKALPESPKVSASKLSDVEGGNISKSKTKVESHKRPQDAISQHSFQEIAIPPFPTHSPVQQYSREGMKLGTDKNANQIKVDDVFETKNTTKLRFEDDRNEVLQVLSPVRNARKEKSICRECNMVIDGEKPVSSSDGKLSGKFHKRCFKCTHCLKPFYSGSVTKDRPSTFYILEDQPYCEYDYHKKNNSLCPGCGFGIEGQCRVVDFESSAPIRYHMECFCCSVPGCPEDFESGYYEVNNRQYCVKHAPSTKSTRRYTRMMPLI